MKQIFLALIIVASSLSLYAADPTVNEKVLDAFNKTFQNVKDVSWSEMPDSYQVKFTQDQMTYRVTYDKNGSIVKTLRYYQENQLPILVLTSIKNKYSDKNIYGVVEESSEEGTYYHITLEDKKNWIQVRSDVSGSLIIENKFKKA